MLPLTLLGNRQFSVTNGVTFIIYAALGGALFLLPVELQVVDHCTPLQAGAALIPLTVVMLIPSPRSGRLATRIGPRLQMGVGPVTVGAGISRVGSLLAVAVLPALAGVSGRGCMHAGTLSAGFRKAMIITAAMCAQGGDIAAIGIRNTSGTRTQRPDDARSERGAVDAPPPGAET